MTKTIHASDRLIAKIDQLKNPTVVGLDPRVPLLPDEIKISALEQFGNTLEGAAKAIELFCTSVIDSISDIVGIIKPQMAFFEQFGSAGLRALELVIEYAKKRDLIVIIDGKRNDIGSTSKAYAGAYLGTVEGLNGNLTSIDADWLTVTPYLGSDGIDPFLEVCQEASKGIFVLVKTSNPSSSDFQNLLTNRHEPFYSVVSSYIKDHSNDGLGEYGYSPLGAVVGATCKDEAAKIRNSIPRSILLVPGYGAQGGDANSCVNCFNHDGYGAIINASRSVIFAYNQEPNNQDWKACIRQAAYRMQHDIIEALTKANKKPSNW